MVILICSQYGMAGLATSFSEVSIDNLQIGKTYSLKKIFNMPYSVKNKDITTSIKIKLVSTEGNYLRPGYQTLKKFDWIKLEKTNFINVKSGETVYSDIIISPPNKKKYLGKKYQVSILAETYTKAKSTLSMESAVESFFRFSIAPVQIKTTQKEIDQLNLNLNYKVSPQNIHINNFSITSNVIKKFLAGILKIENTDNSIHTYTIKSLNQNQVTILSSGYQACPNPDFLSFSESEFTILPKNQKNVEVFLEFPDENKYKNKKYQFTISTDIKSQNRMIKGNLYTRIYVITKD